MKKILAAFFIVLISLSCLISCDKSGNKIIDDTTFIEIEVDNSEETGELSYTTPLKIEDEEIIGKLISIVNSAKSTPKKSF
jgi:hypothetical protein